MFLFFGFVGTVPSCGFGPSPVGGVRWGGDASVLSLFLRLAVGDGRVTMSPRNTYDEDTQEAIYVWGENNV